LLPLLPRRTTIKPLTQVFENCLTGVGVQIHVASAIPEIGFEDTVVRYRTGFMPDTVPGLPGSIPEFRGNEPEWFEILTVWWWLQVNET
jgi:hypothetical protein